MKIEIEPKRTDYEFWKKKTQNQAISLVIILSLNLIITGSIIINIINITFIILNWITLAIIIKQDNEEMKVEEGWE